MEGPQQLQELPTQALQLAVEPHLSIIHAAHDRGARHFARLSSTAGSQDWKIDKRLHPLKALKLGSFLLEGSFLPMLFFLTARHKHRFLQAILGWFSDWQAKRD